MIMFAQVSVCLRPPPPPRPVPGSAAGDPFSGRVSFQLAGPRPIPIPTNLFTFAGGKICLSQYALQVISTQINIPKHVNRTNCQLCFDVIPGCGGLCSDSKPGCSRLSSKTGLSSTRRLSDSPREEPGVASVHKPNVGFGGVC